MVCGPPPPPPPRGGGGPHGCHDGQIGSLENRIDQGNRTHRRNTQGTPKLGLELLGFRGEEEGLDLNPLLLEKTLQLADVLWPTRDCRFPKGRDVELGDPLSPEQLGPSQHENSQSNTKKSRDHDSPGNNRLHSPSLSLFAPIS